MTRVLITPRSFGKFSKEPINMLKNEGIDVVLNDSGNIYTEEKMKELLPKFDGVIVGVDPMNKNVLQNASRLTVVSKYGVGLDNIDLEYCKKNNITVTVTKGANNAAVSDYAFTMMLAVSRRLVEIDNACRKGDWKKRVSLDIYGKKLGILGLGSIGKGVAERAKGFDMEVYAYDIYKDEEFVKQNMINFTDIKTIFKECDFISIHLPLTSKTKHLISWELLSIAKKNLILVNTARGGIIDEDALYNSLKEKRIYGAGLDVFEDEPPADSPLISLENVVIGSHCAASTQGATDKMSTMAVNNVLNVFRERNLI